MPEEALIWDCEANGLLDTATKLHSLQIGTGTGTDSTVYCDALPGHPSIAEGLKRLAEAPKLIGHNVLKYDFPLIEKLYPGTLRLEQMVDTLVMARLFAPEERAHSLDEWGQRLGVLKGTFNGPWDTCTPAMMEYAAQDVIVTRALYNHVKEVEEWGCLDTELKFAWIMFLQEQNGFTLDIKVAQELEAELRGELADLLTEAQSAFPPRWVPNGKNAQAAQFTPKGDNRRHGYTAGCPMTKVILQDFNPGSRKQVGERLIQLGWKPKAYGNDGNPTIDDEILSRLPFPQAKKLVRYFAVSKQLGQLSDGKYGWLQVVGSDGRIHGRVNSVGCAPGRCSHSAPNMAQVSKKDLRMRSVWTARRGWKLIGCDGASIQARALAHYLAHYDDGLAINREINGDKARGTDTHSTNRKALELCGMRVPAGYQGDPGKLLGRLREGAKRALYCVLFGGGDPKLGKTIKEECREAGVPVPRVPDSELGKLARRQLFKAIVGFDRLQAAIQAAARSPKKGGRGYLKALSGMHVKCRSEHSALVFLMQSFEASVMKRAAVIFYFEKCSENGWEHGKDFAFCANVHDEAQMEARPEIAEAVGQAFADSIKEAGERLGSRCPMAGEYSIGVNWKETH